VVTNSDSVRVNRKTIRDDKISGDRDVPIEQQGGCLFAALSHSKLLTAASWIFHIFKSKLSFRCRSLCTRSAQHECVLSVRPSVRLSTRFL
jgi:hypothetical protein